MIAPSASGNTSQGGAALSKPRPCKQTLQSLVHRKTLVPGPGHSCLGSPSSNTSPGLRRGFVLHLDRPTVSSSFQRALSTAAWTRWLGRAINGGGGRDCGGDTHRLLSASRRIFREAQLPPGNLVESRTEVVKVERGTALLTLRPPCLPLLI